MTRTIYVTYFPKTHWYTASDGEFTLQWTLECEQDL